MRDEDFKKDCEERLLKLRNELLSIIDNATESEREFYLGGIDNNAVSLQDRITFLDKQVEARRLSLALKNMFL